MEIKAKITEIGPQALDSNDDFLVLFNSSATLDLRKVALIQEFAAGQQQLLDLQVGQKIMIDHHSFTIQAVGQQVNDQLRAIGHTILYFQDSPSNPQINGVYVTGTMPKLQVGSIICYEQ